MANARNVNGGDERVALIAVVGPADHDLVAPFLAHYAGLGVNEFRLAVHLPTETPPWQTDRLLRAFDGASGPPELISRGPWRAATNGPLRDELRARANAEWHVLSDADEFQFHPNGVMATIDQCRERGGAFATGLVVDRLSARGDMPHAEQTVPELDRTFPRGCFLTPTIPDGDPRKITIAHRDLEVGAGSHHTPSHWHFEYPAPQPVHHFKWRAGVAEKLAARVRERGDSLDPSDVIVNAECSRAVELLSRGPVLDDARLSTFPASLQRLPVDWEARIGPIWRYWMVDRWWEAAED